jgi:hypothetical protein
MEGGSLRSIAEIPSTRKNATMPQIKLPESALASAVSEYLHHLPLVYVKTRTRQAYNSNPRGRYEDEDGDGTYRQLTTIPTVPSCRTSDWLERLASTTPTLP